MSSLPDPPPHVVRLQAWIRGGPGRRARIRDGKYVVLYVESQAFEHREDGDAETASRRAIEAARKAGFR